MEAELYNAHIIECKEKIDVFFAKEGAAKLIVVPGSETFDGWPALRLQKSDGDSCHLPGPVVTCLLLLHHSEAVPQFGQFARRSLRRLGLTPAAFDALFALGLALDHRTACRLAVAAGGRCACAEEALADATCGSIN